MLRCRARDDGACTAAVGVVTVFVRVASTVIGVRFVVGAVAVGTTVVDVGVIVESRSVGGAIGPSSILDSVACNCTTTELAGEA